jgi:uncharacterized protein YfdQ (DUF2303 family)
VDLSRQQSSEPEFVGFTVGGNADKKMVVSEENQRRLAKIFADSESENEEEELNKKLEMMESVDAFKEPKGNSGFKFNAKPQQKEFKCPVKAPA